MQRQQSRWQVMGSRRAKVGRRGGGGARDMLGEGEKDGDGGVSRGWGQSGD